MTSKFALLIGLICFFSIPSIAQETILPGHENCGTEHANHLLMKIDKQYPEYIKKREKAYSEYISSTKTNASRRAGTTVLPTVVHIITAPCTPQGQTRYTTNPSDAVIFTELDKTNLRFKHTQIEAPTFTNPNYGVDVEVEFKLANVDPDGNYTNGIVRHFDASRASGTQNEVATYAQNYLWDNNKYCNIFIFDHIDGVAGVYFGGNSRDFTVYKSSSFWDGLLCHELGHYLNLDHIFQTENGGSCPTNSNCLTSGDNVCDTPPKGNSGFNGGSCAAPANSCTTDDDDLSTNNPYRPTSMGGLGDQPDMLTNYMDYTGSCWDAFTKGQKTRMQADIANFRQDQVAFSATAFSSLPALSVTLTELEAVNMACSNEFQPLINFTNSGSSTLTSIKFDISIDGDAPFVYNWTGSLAPGASEEALGNAFVVNQDGASSLSITISSANNSTNAFYSGNGMCGSFEFYESGKTSPYFNSFAECNLDSLSSVEKTSVSNWIVLSSNRNRDCQECYMQLSGFTSITDTATFCLGGVDLTNKTNTLLTFDLGYNARYSFNTNTLNINVSTDCQPFTNVWSKSNLELSTITPPAYVDDFNVPTCENIKNIEVDLSNYEDMSNVNVCFEGVGEWYSRLLVDNISIKGDIISSTQKDVVANKLSFNNPVADELRINNMNKDDELIIFNTLGQTLIRSSDDIINISHLKTGTYFLLNKTSGFSYKLLKQ